LQNIVDDTTYLTYTAIANSALQNIVDDTTYLIDTAIANSTLQVDCKTLLMLQFI
jgi:hypothetical protein